MQYQLSCEQVNTLMPFYIENKLTEKLTKIIKQHLENCPVCMQKYNDLINLFNKENDSELAINTEQYFKFKKNLSAYIDNELDNNESIKIKKYAISNPMARKDLEDMHSLKRIIHLSFDKTKQELKTDYSKTIINQLVQENSKDYNNLFNKIFIAFTLLISLLVVAIISLLYF